MTKRRHNWGHYLTSGLWVMGVPQRQKGWHHSRVIILFGWAPIESSHYARGGPTFWKPRDLLVLCRLHPTRKCTVRAMCGCVKCQVVRLQYYCSGRWFSGEVLVEPHRLLRTDHISRGGTTLEDDASRDMLLISPQHEKPPTKRLKGSSSARKTPWI